MALQFTLMRCPMRACMSRPSSQITRVLSSELGGLGREQQIHATLDGAVESLRGYL
jgi:hypothetical protein